MSAQDKYMIFQYAVIVLLIAGSLWAVVRVLKLKEQNQNLKAALHHSWEDQEKQQARLEEKEDNIARLTNDLADLIVAYEMCLEPRPSG